MNYTNPNQLAEMHASHYADVQQILANEPNHARRAFLEMEADRHLESYLYWSSHDISVMMEAGFEALGADDGTINYRL